MYPLLPAPEAHTDALFAVKPGDVFYAFPSLPRVFNGYAIQVR